MFLFYLVTSSTIYLIPALVQKSKKCGLHYKEKPIVVEVEDQNHYTLLLNIITESVASCWAWGCSIINQLIRFMDVCEHGLMNFR